MPDREVGYYWVFPVIWADWTVSWYSDGGWEIMGDGENFWKDEEILIVGERLFPPLPPAGEDRKESL